MTLQELINEVHKLGRNEALIVQKAAEQRANYMTVVDFKVGDTVWFDAGPRRGRITGKIAKINTKRYVIDTNQGRWNVTPNLLQKVAAVTA